MAKRSKPIIFYDPDSVQNHDPKFGSLECGDRVNINLKLYDMYKIIGPKPKTVYMEFLDRIHQNNLIINSLSSDPFKPNFIQKIFKITPSSMANRNCHGCTTNTADKVCMFCNTKSDSKHFFLYAHMIDTNILDSDTTYITHTSYTAIKNAVSLVCQMVDANTNGFAIVRPPGHHASSDKSEGFCLVNNIAIGATYALTKGFKKIFIFDFDAHHGNGTQNIFYNDSNVYYCSMHTQDAYPKSGRENELGKDTGYGYNLNIIVPKGIDTDTYLDTYKSKVLPAIRSYDPDLIMVSAGFDGLATDPMAIMKLTPQCYQEITKSLVKFNKPVLMVLEGGYNRSDIEKCIQLCMREL